MKEMLCDFFFFFIDASVYLRSVKDAFDLHQIGDVPGVLGVRGLRKSIVSHKC